MYNQISNKILLKILKLPQLTFSRNQEVKKYSLQLRATIMQRKVPKTIRNEPLPGEIICPEINGTASLQMYHSGWLKMLKGMLHQGLKVKKSITFRI